MTRAQLPWPPDRRALSVVVFGNSIPALQIPKRPDRESGVYLEVLADRLTAAGVPVIPHLEARWFDFLVHAQKDYQARVRAHLPDVLIVQFGLNEYQPWIVPVRVIDHFLRDTSATRTTRAYRKHVAPRIWRKIRDFRRWVAPRLGLLTWQTTPQRFERHLGHLIRRVRWEQAPLVLVLDIDRPGGVLEHFLPGLPERHRIYQETIERVVAETNDPDVRLVRVSELTDAIGPDAMRDAMHYTADTHRRLGEMLAEEILRWLRERAASAD